MEIAPDAHSVNYHGSGATNAIFYLTGTPAPSANQKITLPFVTRDTSAAVAALVVRAATATPVGNPNRYSVSIRASDGLFTLSKVIGGVGTVLATATLGALAIGSHTLELQAVGTAISATLDTTNHLNATDSAISAAGHAGLGIRAPNPQAAGGSISGLSVTGEVV